MTTLKEQPASHGKGKKRVWILLLLLFVAGIAGYWYYTQQSSTGGVVVAVVNGEEITQSRLDFQINQLATAQQIPPLNGSPEEQLELQKTVLEQMIVERLLLEDAERQGISVSNESVDEQFSLVIEQIDLDEEAFLQLLSEQGMTVEGLRRSLHDQLVLEAYFDKLATDNNVSVSDEEVRAVFDAQTEGQETQIQFEDVSSQIRQQLEQQRIADLLPEIVERLKAESDIEILI